MSSARSVRVAGLERALSFSATAWRDVWLVMSLSAAGPAAVFYGAFGPVSRDMSQMLLLGGVVWSAVFWAPQTAGLYRSALNQMSGRDERRHSLGLAGLKWSMTEVRLIGLASLMFLLAVLLVIPAAAVLGAVTIALRTQTELGLQTCMRYGAYAALAVFAAYPLIWLRVSLGGPATVAEGRIRLFQTWPLTKHRLSAVAGRTLVLMTLLPLGVIATLALDPLLRIEPAIGQPYWPLSFAAGGAVAAGLYYGAFVPAMFAGLQTQLYLSWRPKVNGRARAKPVLRVVADVADTAVEDADIAQSPPPMEIDMPALVAANELFAAPEDWERTRRQAASFQIGADRIEWPDGEEADAEAPMSPPLVAASGRDLDAAQRAWTDFEWTVGPCPEDAVDASIASADHEVEPFDYEVHGSPSSVFTSGAASLEDPLLLSHSGPEHWAAPAPAAEPMSSTDPISSDAYAWRYDNPYKLRDLFWLSGAAPPEDEDMDSGHSPRLQDQEPEAAISETAHTLPAPVAVAPSAEEAPPPVQVLAFAAPRPFDMAWAELDPQRPANDPALAGALNEHELSSPPKPVLEPVGPAGHSE